MVGLRESRLVRSVVLSSPAVLDLASCADLLLFSHDPWKALRKPQGMPL